MMPTTLNSLARRGAAAGAATHPDAADVSRAAALVVADTLSCCLIGGDHPTVTRLLGSQDRMVGREAHTLLASPDTLRNQGDVLAVDVTAAHIDEFDAVHPPSGTVPAAVVVPIALQLGAREGLTGPEFLAAVSAGYEVTALAALALGGSRLYQRSWWPAAVTGRLGAAMTASCVLGLDDKRTEQALALAAASAGGLLTEDIFADGHYALLGDAAVLGVQSARRAAAGLRGSSTLLDGPAQRAFHAEPASIANGKPQILDGLHKEYPCATPLQAVIRAARTIGGSEVITAAPAVKIAVPAAMLAYVSADRTVDGPPEAAASAAYALGAVACRRAHDVNFFRAARPAMAYPGRLNLVPTKNEEAVEISVTRPSGAQLSHVEPLRESMTQKDTVMSKFMTLFGPSSRWSDLPDELLGGLTPGELKQRVADGTLTTTLATDVAE